MKVTTIKTPTMKIRTALGWPVAGISKVVEEYTKEANQHERTMSAMIASINSK